MFNGRHQNQKLIINEELVNHSTTEQAYSEGKPGPNFSLRLVDFYRVIVDFI